MAVRSEKISEFDRPSKEFFQTNIQALRKPALLKNLEIGPCTEKWNPMYVKTAVGAEKPVSVHESSSNRLRFLNKNFAYKVLPFGSFIDLAQTSAGDPSNSNFYYYRAVADDARNTVTDFRRDFPNLAPDFSMPDLVEPESVFSCVFRCGSPNLGLWLHYDVLDNILIQVRGRKRAVLFDPEDYDYLYLQGDKSQIHDPESVDLSSFPLFSKARPWVCTMESGDVLFIPAFWMHYMVAEEFSFAVNVFWFNLPRELYDSKDT